jgi:hypothetical protein
LAGEFATSKWRLPTEVLSDSDGIYIFQPARC